MKKILLMLSVLTVQYSYGQFFRSHSFGKGNCTLSIKTMSSTGQTLEVAVNNTGGKKIVSVGLLEGNNSNMTIPAYNWNSSSSRSYNTGETVTFADSWTFAPASSHYIRGFFITPIDTIYGNTIYFTVPGNTYPPSVEIIAISNITSNSASSGGNYLTDGGSSITAKGVVWDLDGNPLIALDPHTSDGTGTSNFTSSITGLNPNTLYYIRAYATNAYGTSYSGRLSFTTLASGTTPIVVTNAISSITENSAVSGGVITFDGNATIIEKGLCYKIGSTPISTDNTINSGSGSASWVTNVTGLLPNTEYHVRAWARNSYIVNGFTVMALGYGQEEIFTTLPSQSCTLPTFIAASCGNSTSNSIEVSANISSDGGCSVTSRGIQWSTDSSFSTILGSVTIGSGTGQYGTTVTGLNCGVHYYFRPWATNSVGTYYANGLIGSGCVTSTCPTCPTISDVYQGGEVIYVYQSGDAGYVSGECHGIISMQQDLYTSETWTNGKNAVESSTSFGYSDWVLPSQYDLDKLYAYKNLGYGGWTTYYWSREEDGSSNAYIILMTTGVHYSVPKTSSYGVRAIRYF